MNLFTSIIVYPSDLTTMRLDLRTPDNEPYMLVCFNHILDPETDEKIIRKVEKAVNEIAEICDMKNNISFEDMKIKPIRDQLTKKHETTTYFKELISLS